MTIAAVVPPTPVQEGMIYQGLIADDPRLYNEQLTLTLRGTLDRRLFQQSVDSLVSNHSVLRSSYVHEGVTRSQAVILRERKTEVQWIDLAGLDEPGQQARLHEVRDELERRAFDLAKDPLLRFTVSSLRPDEHVVIVGFHHIILDGWSLSILLKELLDTYSRCARGEGRVMVDDDFASYLNRLQNYPEAGARAFWKEHLSGPPERGDLPIRLRRHHSDLREIKEETVSLTPQLTCALYQAAAQLGVTANAFHQALLAVVLMKSQRLDDLVFGVVNSGRQALGQEAERAIGMFINTIPLRATAGDHASFADVARDQHRLLFAVQEHSHLALPEIKRLAGFAEDPFRVLFTYENYPLDTAIVDGSDGGALTVSSVEMREVTNYDLSVTVFPSERERLRITYNAKVYDPETIHAFLGHYAWVAQQAIAAPDIEVRDIRLATDETARRVDELVNRNHHVDFPDLTLVDAFDRVLGEHADRPAVTYQARTLSYAELDHRARAIAGILESRGVRRGDLVALMLGRSPDQVAAILAILRMGAVYVPLDPLAPLPRLRIILEDASPTMILTADGLDAGLGDYARLDVRLTEPCPEYTGESRCRPDDPAYVIYTSGSTGRPKGVTVTHANVISLLLNAPTPFAFGPKDVWTMFHSYAFDFSVWEIWGALLFGGRLVVVPAELTQESRLFHELVVREGVTVLSQTPGSFYLFCAADADAEYPGLRLNTVVLGGEALAPDRIRQWQANRPEVRVVNMYGITETTVHVTWHDVTTENNRDGASIVGAPLPTLKIKIVDSGLNVVPPGIPGEILVAGAGVSRGYHANPGLTEQRFIELPGQDGRWYRSGDLALVRADGTIEYLGRIDSQVQVRGFRVELGEIEARLGSAPEVSSAVVTTKETENGMILVAHVVPTAPGSVDLTLLRAYAAEGLPSYMVPNAFHLLDELPLNVNGKVDRRLLSAWQVPADDDLESESVSPTEAAVARIWAQALDRDQVGVDVDFFEVGGHSLLLMRIVAAIERELGIRLGVKDFLDASTVRGVSAMVDAQLAAGRTAELIHAEPDPANRGAEFPLTDIQLSYALGRNSALELGGVSTHLYLEIETELDIDRLDQALSAVIARHPMLTACILPNGRQRFTRPAPRSYLTRADLAAVGDAEREDMLAQARERMSHHIFPLGESPMFEFVAFRLDEKRHLLCVSLDPLIADAGSMRIVSDELMAFYDDPACQLPVLEFTFRDYVLALEKLREGETWEVDRQFWQARVSDFPGAPTLPTRCEIAAIKAPRFARRQHRVSPQRWTALKEYASRFGVGPTALLLDLYSEALHPFTGQDRFAINLTVANRVPVHPDVDDLVGDFTSLMLIAVDRSPDSPHGDRARAVQEVLNEALEHRLYDGVDFVRDLAKARGAQHQAIMPVVFTATLEQGDARRGWDALGRTTMGVNQTSQVILDNQVVEIGGGLDIAWDYVEDLFDPALMDGMFAGYVALLEAPSATHSHAASVPGYNDTDIELPVACLHHLFLKACDRGPEAPAVQHGEMMLSYGALQVRARRWAAFLVAQGVRPGDRVGVLGRRSIETIAVLLATQFIGSAYVPIDPSLPEERIRFVTDHSQCALVIDADQEQDLPENGLDVLPEVALDDQSYVIYTSGSTGRPKGVVVTHRQAANTILAVNQQFDIGPDDRVLGISSLGFDLSVYDVFGSLAAGACLVISGDPRDVKGLIHTVESAGVTVWNSVPALLDLALARLEVEGAAGHGPRVSRPGPAQLQHPNDVFASQETCYSGARDERIMFDRDASEEFKQTALLRNRAYTGRLLQLPDSQRLAEPLRGRRSWREFDPTPIPLSSVTDVLGVLRQFDENGVTRYTYASAGGLYPIDVYLYIKPGRVEGLAAGTYYYNPRAHTLELVSDETWTESVHLYGNTTIFESSAVTLTLVYDAAASFPKYGSMGYFQACLDAGIMTELMTRACEAADLGSCSIGNMNWEQLRRKLRLDAQQVPLHVLELGSKSAEAPSPREKVALVESRHEGIQRLSTLRVVLLSGDWIPVSLPARLRVFNDHTQLYSLGGATEGAIWSIWYPIEDVDPTWSAIPYGRPMPNQHMYVLDARGRACPFDVPGEIHIGGVGVAAGYDAEPEKTAAAFVEHPAHGRLYRTGDFGTMGRDGVIHFLGRRDQQVKIQGMRIELEEIDAQTLTVGGVTAAKTVVRREGESVVLVCYYVGSATATQVRKHLAARLPRYMVPGFVVRLDELPLSSNGKVDVKALDARELVPQATEDDAPAAQALPPQTVSDVAEDHYVKELLEIWRGVLNRETLQPDDSFFDAGGDSAMLIRSHALLDAAYPDAVSMIEIFSHPSVRDLAQLLRERVGAAPPDEARAPAPPERTHVARRQAIPAGPGSALAAFCAREHVSQETTVLAAVSLLDAKVRGSAAVQLAVDEGQGAHTVTVKVAEASDFAGLCDLVSLAPRSPMSGEGVPATAVLFGTGGAEHVATGVTFLVRATPDGALDVQASSRPSHFSPTALDDLLSELSVILTSYLGESA